MNSELVTKDFLKETLSHEIEKFGTLFVTQFERIGGRFDRVELRLEKVETRLENVESRLGNVEVRLIAVENRVGTVEEGLSSLYFRFGKVENNLLQLSDTLEAEMAFTSNFRDTIDKRVRVLENKEA